MILLKQVNPFLFLIYLDANLIFTAEVIVYDSVIMFTKHKHKDYFCEKECLQFSFSSNFSNPCSNNLQLYLKTWEDFNK